MLDRSTRRVDSKFRLPSRAGARGCRLEERVSSARLLSGQVLPQKANPSGWRTRTRGHSEANLLPQRPQNAIARGILEGALRTGHALSSIDAASACRI